MSRICPPGEGPVPPAAAPPPGSWALPSPLCGQPGRSSLGQAAGGQCPLVPGGLRGPLRSLPCHSGACAENKTKGPRPTLVTGHKASARKSIFARKMAMWPRKARGSSSGRGGGGAAGESRGHCWATGKGLGDRVAAPQAAVMGFSSLEINIDRVESLGFPEETLGSRWASALMKNSLRSSVVITASEDRKPEAGATPAPCAPSPHPASPVVPDGRSPRGRALWVALPRLSGHLSPARPRRGWAARAGTPGQIWGCSLTACLLPLNPRYGAGSAGDVADLTVR